MPEARMQSKPADSLEDVDFIKAMLKAGTTRVTGGGDQPTIHLPYHVDNYSVDSKIDEPCLIVAIPLNMAFGDLRVKPRRWDDRQSKWLTPTLGITISATCAADEPPVFSFRDSDGAIVRLTAKKGLTLNLGLMDKPVGG